MLPPLFNPSASLRALALTAAFASPLAAAPGSLDKTFNGTGSITVESPIAGNGRTVEIMRDGRIVVAGQCWKGLSTEVPVGRLLPNGAFDVAFTGGGARFLNMGYNMNRGDATAVLPDGKILLAGCTGEGWYAPGYLFLTRLKVDGNPDSSFQQMIRLGTKGVVAGMHVLPSGKILIGASLASEEGSMILIRRNADGTQDTSFGNGTGFVTHDFEGIETAHAMAVQKDGKIILAGSLQYGSDISSLVARFNADGTLDSGGFNAQSTTPGSIRTRLHRLTDEATSIAIQGDGKIVVAGTTQTRAEAYSDVRMFATRYTAAGTKDLSFATGGTFINDSYSHTIGQKVVVQPDGKIVLGGHLFRWEETFLYLRRLRVDGTPDPTFGSGGKVETSCGWATGESMGMALQADGRLVVSGSGNTDGSSRGGMLIARFNMLCQPDLTIRKDGSWKGNNIHNTTGSGQNVKSVIQANGGKSTVNIRIQNDGHDTDGYTLQGTAGNRHFTVRYFSKGYDVTAAVAAGTFRTKSQRTGEISTINAEITAVTGKKGKTCRISLRATSSADAGAKDVALIELKSK
ncbi:MAG: hypothetical protein EOP88_10595 [Verrucomicrobiaceae bacterium]|nr:MAG: hypothetical protein EOP88_10595 [Verrucomicrobiaceae bacterium]